MCFIGCISKHIPLMVTILAACFYVVVVTTAPPSMRAHEAEAENVPQQSCTTTTTTTDSIPVGDVIAEALFVSSSSSKRRRTSSVLDDYEDDDEESAYGGGYHHNTEANSTVNAAAAICGGRGGGTGSTTETCRDAAAKTVQRFFRRHLWKRYRGEVANWDGKDALTLDPIGHVARTGLFVFNDCGYDALSMLRHFCVYHEDPLTRGHIRRVDRERCRVIVGEYLSGVQRLYDIASVRTRGNRGVRTRLKAHMTEIRRVLRAFRTAEADRLQPQQREVKRQKLNETYISRLASSVGDRFGSSIQDVHIHPDGKRVDVSFCVDDKFAALGRQIHALSNQERPRPVPAGD
jgi:hypothetical protein